MSTNLKGFYRKSEARKVSPCVSRPDLVAARNAAIRGDGDLRPFERKPVKLDPRPIDSRVKFFRAINDPKGYLVGSCYAVLSPTEFTFMRKNKTLEPWLESQRESGVVIRLSA